ncbi:hypothetical protein FKM82_008537 [Ascaphus truei]
MFLETPVEKHCFSVQQSPSFRWEQRGNTIEIQKFSTAAIFQFHRNSFYIFPEGMEVRAEGSAPSYNVNRLFFLSVSVAAAEFWDPDLFWSQRECEGLSALLH